MEKAKARPVQLAFESEARPLRLLVRGLTSEVWIPMSEARRPHPSVPEARGIGAASAPADGAAAADITAGRSP